MKQKMLLSMGLIISLLSQPIFAQKSDATTDAKAEVTQTMEDMVVSASRSNVTKEEIPTSIDLISSEDIQLTTERNLVRVLKKNASVDVIDYPGVLGGIGLRGFRAEYSGITKHTLVLIDGRPAGATNLATLLKGNIERIEVLKGPASSLYGAEAMGGVVNIITKKSKGDIQSEVTAGLGSFGATKLDVRSGGNITEDLDFDIFFYSYDQADDFVMGGGETRINTTYGETSGNIRMGYDVNDRMRLDFKSDVYIGIDIESPNALYNITKPSEKDLDRITNDLTMTYDWGESTTKVTVYNSTESQETTKKEDGKTPYKSYEKETNWFGTQISHNLKTDNHDINIGLDYQKAGEESKSYTSSGSQNAPSRPYFDRSNIGLWGDGMLRFMEDQLVVNVGTRFDKFDLATLDTPLMASNNPATETFIAVSPRVGVKFFLNEDRKYQIHSTLGTAFVPPNAYELAGYYDDDGDITRGNPNLNPETSTTFDVGFTMNSPNSGLYFDVTAFITRVKDKITGVVVSATEDSFTNALNANMSGLEWEFNWDVSKNFGFKNAVDFYLSGTHLLEAREEVSEGTWRDIYNVAALKYNTGIKYKQGIVSSKFNIRYVGPWKDLDRSISGKPETVFGDFTVLDIAMTIDHMKNHKIDFGIDNLLDTYYEEKPSYPSPGRSFYVNYSMLF